MSNDYYKIGSYNVQCAVCGSKRKRQEVRMTWRNFLACIDRDCWDAKHPNDNPRRMVVDNLPVQHAQPRLPIDRMSTTDFPGNGLLLWGGNTTWGDPLATWGEDSSQITLSDITDAL